MTKQIDIKVTKIFKSTKKALKDKSVVIHKGGTGAAKTYDIMQYLFFYIGMTTQNKVITVISESFPHLKIGTMRYADNFMSKHELYDTVKHNKTEHNYLFPTGTILEFFSADRIEKALGARRYLLYGNEINSLKKDIWDELARRSEIVIADFNPTSKFWLEEWLQYYDDYEIVKSNYLDNAFLPEHEKKRIEKRAKLDPNFRRIHIDCEYGNAEDLVFLPENIILIDEFPADVRYTYGMDFGFANPTTLIKVGIVDDDIFIDEALYKPGLNEKHIVEELRGIDKRDKIVGDPEDKRMINHLFNSGFNIFKAKKPPGSVDFGISFLQGKRLHITKRSVRTLNEFRNLMYSKNRLGDIVRGKYSGDDHCFVAETLITCIDGEKQISKIKKGDTVLTSAGYKKVKNNWVNGVKKVKKFTIDVGSYENKLYICGTDKHKFKLNKQWQQIKTITAGDTINLYKSLTVSYTRYTKTKDIILNIMQECTETFGNFTMGKYRMVIMYIILMVIRTIIRLKTLKLLKGQNICLYILKNIIQKIKRGLKYIWHLLGIKQSFGIKAGREENGINNMQRKRDLATWIMGLIIVRFVIQDLKKQQLCKNIALINASLSTEEIMALTTKKESAVSVGTNLLATNIIKLDFVQECVVQSVQQEKGGTQKVYDLEVDGNAEYFANKMLVHNSVDAVRYALEEVSSKKEIGFGMSF